MESCTRLAAAAAEAENTYYIWSDRLTESYLLCLILVDDHMNRVAGGDGGGDVRLDQVHGLVHLHLGDGVLGVGGVLRHDRVLRLVRRLVGASYH